MSKKKKAKDDKNEIKTWPLHEMSLTPPWADDTKQTVPTFKVDEETEKMIEAQTKRIEAYFEKLKKEKQDE